MENCTFGEDSKLLRNGFASCAVSCLVAGHHLGSTLPSKGSEHVFWFVEETVKPREHVKFIYQD